MSSAAPNKLDARAPLPPIPAKRYFTIGEVSELCGVKPHVLRYWEQEFTQLRPMKRRGNRRYYQHHEVLLVRRIRDLLYEQGFTISGARNRLGEALNGRRKTDLPGAAPTPPAEGAQAAAGAAHLAAVPGADTAPGAATARPDPKPAASGLDAVRADLLAALDLLRP
jgi:DNA-binding transcriptional MerR regulator